MEKFENGTLTIHERVYSRSSVLSGSEFIFNEITEYIYFSLNLILVEFKYKSE